MTKRFLITMAALGLGLALLAVGGCNDDDPVSPPTVAAKPFVSAFVDASGGWRKADSGSRYGGVVAVVSGFAHFPAVTVNDTGLTFDPTLFGSGGAGFTGQDAPAAGTTATMVVSFDGKAEPGTATFVVPGLFEIVGERDVPVDPLGGVGLTWSRAAAAERYIVQGYFDCSYVDTAATVSHWSTEFFFFTADTSVAFSADDIWPSAGEVDSVTSFWADMDVVPVTGPVVEGAPANVTGGCDGYVISFGAGLDWNFELNTPGKAAVPTPGERPVDWPAAIRALLAP